MFRSYSLPEKYLFVVPEIFVVLAVVDSSWVEIRVRTQAAAAALPSERRAIYPLTAQLEKAKFLLSSRPQTGIRSPSISGPRPSFLARFRRRSSPPASAGPIPVRTLSGSRADAERVDPELGGSCGDASVLFAAEEYLCGVAPRRCFGPTRRRRNVYLWCLLLLTRLGLRYKYERE